MTIPYIFTVRDDLASDAFDPGVLSANLRQVLGHHRGESGGVENIHTARAAR
ncbi:MAG: hypothetical protein WAM94_04865 [Chromatiaceae bacterium]